MAEAAEVDFSGFDWSASTKWQTYFENLYPTPPRDKVNYWKRKWYQSNVNAALLLHPSTVDSAANTGSSTASASRPSPTASSNVPTTSTAAVQPMKPQHLILVAAILCGCIYTLPLGRLVSRFYFLANVLFVGGFAMSLITMVGVPQLNGAYFQRALLSEPGVALMVAVTAASLRTWMVFVPDILSALLLFGTTLGSRVQLAAPIQQYADLTLAQIAANRYSLLAFRGHALIFIGLSSIIRIFTRQLSFLVVLFYWNGLRFLYPMDPFLQASFRTLDRYLDDLLTKLPPAHNAYQTVKSYLSRVTANAQNQAQRS